ncbi:hypothetical protein ACQJBY_031427 [Aegilops geniculata]
MEALNELCDLVAAHPDLLLADRLTWLSSRCAPPASPASSPPQRASRAHLHSLHALARLLPAGAGPPAAPLLAFLTSRAFLSPAFWPQSFAPAPFLAKLLPLLAAAPASPALSSALSAALLAALDAADPASAPLARAFLSAAAAKPPQLLPADTAPVAQRLFLEFPGSDEAPPRAKGKGEDAKGEENGGIKEAVQRFEGEQIEALERKEVAFRLIVQMLGGEGGLEADKVAKVRNAAAWQVRSLTDFLKIRKRDWKEQGAQLRVRINTKLSCCQAAVVVLVRSVSALEADSKASKDMLQQTLAWFIEATKSCILSSWRKLKICEELFCTLLNGISQITVSRGGQLLPVLLIPLKPLVVSTCSQADMTGCSPGALFEAVVKLSCEIIEFGWTKDRALVDTFIMRLAAYVRERNDYEEELLDAISRVACLGFEKSYRESIVLMTRSYLDKVKAVGAAENNTLPSEATAERTETLPAGFLLVASNLTSTKLRSDYRHRLLSLCSDVGLAAESKSGRSGADLMGPLLPAVAEICSDFDPVSSVEPSLLKLFRNLWFYIVLFGLAPPIQNNQASTKPVSTALNTGESCVALQAVAGPYMWNSQWSVAVQRIAQGSPPLVVSSVKWLEDELELNALHNPGSRRGNGDEKAAVGQRTALSAALGGRVEVAAMSTISGVKATYLLAVAFLEILRFSGSGGILSATLNKSNSSFGCVFEYLLTPNLTPAVTQCLTAVVHRAFETMLSWLEERTSDIGEESNVRESVLSVHAGFLIKSMSQRDEHVRDLSVKLLTQLKEKFPQVLWNSSCLDLLLISVHNELTSGPVSDPAWIATIRSLYQKIAREWITSALSYAPCTTQGLIQENFCKPSGAQRTQHTADVVSLLSEIRICIGKNDWNGIRTANIPAVMDSAAAASGARKEAPDITLEVLSTAVVSATVKCNHAGEIAGMRRLFSTMGGLNMGVPPPGTQSGQAPQSFDEVFLSKFVRLLQDFVVTAEKQPIDNSQFRETCSQATALLLDHLVSDSRTNLEGFSQLIRLLCWCPAYISTPDAMETGIYIWTWLVSAAPSLGPLVLAELVDAWLWTMDTKRGLFASDMKYCGPDAKLRPHLIPGEPEAPPEKDPVEAIIAHRLWLGFFIDRFEVVRHDSIEQLLLLGRMLQGMMKSPTHFSHHPAATGTFFTAMQLGLNFCSCQDQFNLQKCNMGLQLLEDRVYRAALGWFAYAPEFYESPNKSFAQREAQSVSIFVHNLQNTSSTDSGSKPQGREGELNTADQIHPVWGSVDNYATAKEKRKQLLLMLSQNEADRLEVWAQPINTKDTSTFRGKISSDKWIDHCRTAFAVDPRIALSMPMRFPTNAALQSEITQLVQTHILELRTIPEALPFFITPKAVDENSALLQQLPHWAPCSVTQALEFFTSPYKGHPRVMAYVLRVMETYPPETVTFFMPQLVQSLRYDDGKLVEGYLLGAARRSNIFAHILIWHLQGECEEDDNEKEGAAPKPNAFQSLLPAVRQKIVDGFTQEARDMFEREFDFFDKVTSISGVLFPLPKEERRAGIKRELEKITIPGDDLYLPTATNKLVRGIQLDSGIPLQSAAKVPIMITFNVIDRDGNPNDVMPQACIFKVGDDCRQDVLALQVIALLRDIFEAVGLNLYLFPYGVLPTGPERGIIEVVPNTRSRNQMGETTDGGLLEIFQQDYGPVGSPSFEAARQMFIVSSAGYAVASLLLQPKDRHNGNLLFDSQGRLVHIDFGFILEISPGGNMGFESAHFKLSHEMTQLLDPSGTMKSDTWNQFLRLCVKGYLAGRRHMNGIVTTVQLMVDSGLPCFSRGEPIANLRKRFHPEMNEREAANFMVRTCVDAYNKWTTAGYDLIQYLQQGIEK